MEGKILGEKYQVIEKLREQRFYDVYEARVVNSDRRALLKVIKKNLVDENTFGALKPNLAVVASLRHDGVSAMRDYGEAEGTIYLAEEYFDGAHLKDIMAQAKTINAVQALGQGIKVVDAVGSAHSKGVMHGLLTPESVLVGRDLSVKVGDFYFLHSLTADLKTTEEFQGRDVVYCAPEVVAGSKPTFASDVYSIGVILYELLTGRAPFEKEGALAIALEKERVEVKSPKEINPDIPRLLETVILKCMKQDPEARYADARELVTELHLCRSSLARVMADEGVRTKMPGTAEGGRKDDKRDTKPAAAGWKTRTRDSDTRSQDTPKVKFGDEIEVEPEPEDSNLQEDDMDRKGKLPQGFITFLISLFALILLMVVGYHYVMKRLGPGPGGPTVLVPSVEHKSVVEAKALLGQENLSPKIAGQQYSEEVPEGYVVSQEPPGGARVKSGREVDLIVSAGEQTEVVPKVVSLTVEDAKVILQTAGFTIGEERTEYDENVAEGFVTSQVPEAGEERYIGYKINLTVSKGSSPRLVNMPRLVNLRESDARNILEMNDLMKIKTERLETGAGISGYVVGQSVLENVRVNPEKEITLYVATPPDIMSIIEVKGVVNLNISADNDFQEVLVFVFDQDGARQVYRQTHADGDTAKIPISGYGKTRVMVFLDGILAKEQTL
ncbi:PASTA domain-containing protein [bacterium]